MSSKNNLNKDMDSTETIEEPVITVDNPEIFIDGTEDGFTITGVDSEGLLSESTTSQPLTTDVLNDIIGLFRVNAIIMTFLILTLILTSVCKFILQTKKLSVKKLYLYETASLLVILWMSYNSTSLAFFPGSINCIFPITQYFLLGCPVIITVLEIIKSKKSNQEDNK